MARELQLADAYKQIKVGKSLKEAAFVVGFGKRLILAAR